MKLPLLERLALARDNPNVQDAALCLACWLGFVGIVVTAVALPA